MKKYDLLKVLGITFLIVMLISWVVPAGIYYNGTFTSLETTAPIGLYDAVEIPLLTFNNFASFGILFLAIGGFYGVLNKTGAYSKLVENLVNKWKKDNKKFLIITIVLFSLLSSVVGLNNVLFLLIPFFVAVLLKLNFNKITTFAATVGSLLVGQIGSTLGSGIWGYINVIFGSVASDISMFTLILVRLVLWLIITVLYVLMIMKSVNNKEELKEIKKEIKKSEKTKSKENKELAKASDEVTIPLYSKVETKKTILPLIIILFILLGLLVLGVYSWSYTFNIEVFTTIHEQITEFEINGYPILSNILGSVSSFGSWNNYDISFVLIIMSLVIAWLYSIKLSEAFDAFVSGVKQMLIPALYAILSCVVFTFVLSKSYNFVYTMVNQFTAGEEFTLFGTIASALVTSFTYNDFPTMINSFSLFFSSLETNLIYVVALIFQTIYGLVMLLAPTSVFLLAGLSYLNVSYKDWIKYIWKFALILLLLIIVISFMATMI